jgi:hypothetical protein
MILARCWYPITREIDKRVLWPACREIAIEHGKGLHHARGAFYIHASRDPAWLVLGHDEVLRRVNELK